MYRIVMLEPDIALWGLFLFFKVKSKLKKKIFESVKAMETKATKPLNKMTLKDFQNCLVQQKIWTEGSRNR